MKVTLLNWDTINKVHGIDELGNTVYLNILGYYPFIYINVDNMNNIPKENNIVKKEIVTRKMFYGFDGEKDHRLVKLYFKNTMDLYIFCKNFPFKVYEKKNQDIKFFHVTGIKPCGTYDIDITNNKWTGHYSSIVDKYVDYIPNNLREMTIDIECINPQFNFPDSERQSDIITHIGVAMNEEDYCFSIEPCNKINDNHFIFSSEKELLIEFSKFVKKMDPHIIITYNGDCFDNHYIYNRMIMNNIIPNIGINDKEDQLIESTFQSAQRGRRDFKRVRVNGRLTHDILQSIEKVYTNLDSYKLDNVAKKFIGSQKDDIKPMDIHKSYVNKDIELSTKVALYCIQDTRLTYKLYKKLKLFLTTIQMANTCSVPYQYVLEKGETIKTMSLILNETYNNDFVIQDIQGYKMEYTGATVIPPKETGIFKNPTITLDFASLYPSIIMAHNLCYMTIVKDNKYMNLPGYEYETLKIDHGNSHFNVTYVKNVNGFSKHILETLSKKRKEAKKEMKKHDFGSFEYDLYDKKQLSYKLAMNSYYGFLASMKLSCPEIAATVTFYGRQMIHQTKDYIHRNMKDVSVIYGDTDSAFIYLKDRFFERMKIYGSNERLSKALEIGPGLAQRVTKIFKAPILLEFEKVYSPLILLSKKRYIGVLYTKSEKYDYIDTKGIVLKRRDNFNYMKIVYQNLVDIMLWKDSNQKLLEETLINSLKDLSLGKVDKNELKYSVKFKGDGLYQNDNIQQNIYDKIKQRQGYDIPTSGERISYCYIKVLGRKNLLARDKAEHFDYVIDNGMDLDYKYYISKLKTPIKELLKGIVNVDAIFFDYESDGYKRKNPHLNPSQTKIMKFFK